MLQGLRLTQLWDVIKQFLSALVFASDAGARQGWKGKMDVKWGNQAQAGTCGHELEPLRTDRKAFVFFDDVGVLQKEGGAGVGLLLSCATQ